ncbi:MAG: permease [Halothermotrichaceae bacterium]
MSNIIDDMKKYKLLVFTFMAYIITGIINFNLLQEAAANTWIYLKEMLEILPAVFVLTGLINAWVPAEVIMKYFGNKSGVRGKLISVLVGSVSAGPIYAAFPLSQSLLNKGASIGNTIIIISAWAVVKIPMLIVESKFLGITFAGVRYLLTIPAIIIMGSIAEKIIKRNEITADKNEDNIPEEILDVLPGHNCGSCCYNSCRAYAEAVITGKVAADLCVADDGKIYQVYQLLN